MQIDTVALAIAGDVEALVNFPLAVHALAHARFAHQRGKAMLQHACTDAAEYVVAGVLFQHHVGNAFAVEQLGQQQAGGAAANDGHLCLHVCLLKN